MKHARSDYARIQDPAGLIPADEPVFLLRGQDKFAAAIVGWYADLVESAGGSEDVVRLSREHAARMDAWPKKKAPDISCTPTPASPPSTAAAAESVTLRDLLDGIDALVRNQPEIGGYLDGVVLRANRVRAALTAAGQATPTKAAAESKALREALQAYLNVQCRMLARWSEGDENVKRDLWRNLHACEEPARAALTAAGRATPPDAVVWDIHEMARKLARYERVVQGMASGEFLIPPADGVPEDMRRGWMAAREAVQKVASNALSAAGQAATPSEPTDERRRAIASEIAMWGCDWITQEEIDDLTNCICNRLSAGHSSQGAPTDAD